jgi:hypothetical protein
VSGDPIEVVSEKVYRMMQEIDPSGQKYEIPIVIIAHILTCSHGLFSEYYMTSVLELYHYMAYSLINALFLVVSLYSIPGPWLLIDTVFFSGSAVSLLLDMHLLEDEQVLSRPS